MNVNSTQSRRSFITATCATFSGLTVSSRVSAQDSIDRYIIKTTEPGEISHLDIVHQLDSVNLCVVRGSEKEVGKSSKSYAPDIVTATDRSLEPQKISEEGSATNEPLFDKQWDKQVQNIPAAHSITRGEGSRVAVIDSGIDPSHPDLKHAVNENLSKNFTNDGGDYSDVDYHGTHVSGIIAANDHNNQGIVGSAPRTDLVALRVFERFRGALFGDILAAVVYSAEINADVANLSLGSILSRYGLGSFYGKALNKTMTYARREGTLIVASAGNSSTDLQHDSGLISLPNEGAQVLSVSATGPTNFNPDTGDSELPYYAPTTYTNYGTNVIDIAAPGGRLDSDIQDRILSTVPTDLSEFSPYGYLAGTSMAAPQVTGAAALIASVNQKPSSPTKITRSLKKAAETPDEYSKRFYGSGFINIPKALEIL